MLEDSLSPFVFGRLVESPGDDDVADSDDGCREQKREEDRPEQVVAPPTIGNCKLRF
jgi:hypothetical protein